jgi:hypothetical protein
MIVRLKLRRGPTVARKPGKNRHLALASSALLTPVSLMAYVLGFWRLASDMGMAGAFVFYGLFSHWQIWIALAVALHATASLLNRYGRGQDLPTPRELMLRLGLKLPRLRPH